VLQIPASVYLTGKLAIRKFWKKYEYSISFPGFQMFKKVCWTEKLSNHRSEQRKEDLMIIYQDIACWKSS